MSDKFEAKNRKTGEAGKREGRNYGKSERKSFFVGKNMSGKESRGADCKMGV